MHLWSVRRHTFWHVWCEMHFGLALSTFCRRLCWAASLGSGCRICDELLIF